MVYTAVEVLTRKKGQNYFDYIRSIRDSKNPLAIEVKLLDLNDHMYNSDYINESLYRRYVSAEHVLTENDLYLAERELQWKVSGADLN